MPQVVRDIFENYVKETYSVDDCIAVNSGTSALIATLWSMDLGPEDEVITTPFTYIATSNAILIAGAKPVFVDIDPISYLIDPEKIEAAITPNTKAIMPVHLYGRICDMDKINAIAKKHNLVVIEDTAQAFGSGDAGFMSDAGCFSFYKTKNISTFEGGMICVPPNSKLDARKIRSICNQGQEGKYNHVNIGFNFRLAEPLCLMALEQMKLHMTGIRAEIGIRGPKEGHYPNVVYEQPVYIKKGITGDCPIAERIAKSIRTGEFEFCVHCGGQCPNEHPDFVCADYQPKGYW
jgi:dTDP-4-amino-4,6-dideoxygalactose transaminase